MRNIKANRKNRKNNGLNGPELVEKMRDISGRDINNCALIGCKVRLLYGHVFQDYRTRTLSPSLVRTALKNVEWDNYYLDGDYAIIPVKGSKMIFHDKEWYIINVDGTVFNCRTHFWYDRTQSKKVLNGIDPFED